MWGKGVKEENGIIFFSSGNFGKCIPENSYFELIDFFTIGQGKAKKNHVDFTARS